MLSIPALFGRANFDELLFLDNEAGAKSVTLGHSTDIARYSFNNRAIDISTAVDYERLIRRSS